MTEEKKTNKKRNNVYVIYNDNTIETHKNACSAMRAYQQNPDNVKMMIRGIVCHPETVERVVKKSKLVW